MKKMGLLIALATVLTVGGVYASWQYAGNADLSSLSSLDVTLAGKTSDKTAGTVTPTSTITLNIDQLSEGDYHGVLKPTAAGQKCVFKFTYNDFASSEWKDSVKFSWSISIVEDGNYTYGTGDTSDDVVVLVEGTDTSGSSVVAVDAGTKSATFEITAEQVCTAVKFNSAITLPTPESHAQLETDMAALKPSIKISCTVSEDNA